MAQKNRLTLLDFLTTYVAQKNRLPLLDFLATNVAQKNRLPHDTRFSKTNYLKTNLLKQIKKISLYGHCPIQFYCFWCKFRTYITILKIKLILFIQLLYKKT